MMGRRTPGAIWYDVIILLPCYFHLVAISIVVMVYRATTLRGLANSQMVVGAIMIVFGVACIISAQHWSSYVGFGVWVGLWVSLICCFRMPCVQMWMTVSRLYWYSIICSLCFSLLSFDLPVISFDKVTLNLPKLLISVPPGIRNRRERQVGTFETLEFRFHVKEVIIFGAAGLYSLNLTFCCVIFALKWSEFEP